MKQKIRSSKEFKRIFDKGKKIIGDFFLVYWETNENGFHLGQVISKKVGIAVVRNKIRRRIRYYFSIQKKLPKVNFVVVAKNGITPPNWQETENDLKQILKRI